MPSLATEGHGARPDFLTVSGFVSGTNTRDRGQIEAVAFAAFGCNNHHPGTELKTIIILFGLI